MLFQLSQTHLTVCLYLSAFSIITLITIVFLLVSKGGDKSLFFGIILGSLGAISSITSFVIAIINWKLITTSQSWALEKKLFLFSFIVNIIIILLTIVAVILSCYIFKIYQTFKKNKNNKYV